MSKTYARFAATPIGASLAARDGGLTLTTTAAVNINRTARSDIDVTAGTNGCEFVVWGDDALNAVVGIVSATASLATYVGGDANGIGWELATGEIIVNGVVVASGLPAVAKQEIVGVRVQVGSPHTVKFYKGGTEVHSRTVSIAGALYLAASLGTTNSGGLIAALNAGQWGFRSAAAQAGWYDDNAGAGSAKLGDEDFVTATTDAPASAHFLGKIEDGLSLISAIDFWAWGGGESVQGAVAQLRVCDPEGELDTLALGDVRGLAVSIKQATQGGTLASATAVARFVMDRIEVQDDSYKTIYLNDAHSDLDEPLAFKPFLPNIAALSWSPLPVVIGAVCSVPALPVNSDGTVRWLADSPLVEVSAVLDRGDAMEGGTFSLTPDAQQLTMTSPPVGPVVCDVSSIGAAMTPATLQQALTAIFGCTGKSAWSSADAAAIDAATGYAGIGYYTRDSVTVRQALATLLPSYGAWWWQAADGVLRFARIVNPDTYGGTLAFDMDGTGLSGDVVVVPDKAPNLSRRMAYRPNAQALAVSDLVTDVVDVPQWRRDELTAAWRGQVYGGGALAERYRHADAADPIVSLFYRSQDAQAEIDRVIAMYAVPRFFYQVAWRDTAPPPSPGAIGRLTYDRYPGLKAGKKLLVRQVVRQPGTGDLQLILWG